MTADNKARGHVVVRMFGAPPKLRTRRRKYVPETEIDASYDDRLSTLRAESTPLDREAIIRACVKECNCELELARAGLRRKFPTPEKGGRGKRLK